MPSNRGSSRSVAVIGAGAKKRRWNSILKLFVSLKFFQPKNFQVPSVDQLAHTRRVDQLVSCSTNQPTDSQDKKSEPTEPTDQKGECKGERMEELWCVS